MFTFGSLFAGIGGFDRGFEKAGGQCKWQVEIDEYCRSVLAKHWPCVDRYEDITTVDASDLLPVDIVCGGFPCQDISQAGTRTGIDGSRSGLWSEFHRIIRVLRPPFAVIENVSALLIRGLDRVLGDLAAIGYDAEWQTVRASDFALPHRRERIIIVSYPNQLDESPWLGNGIGNRKTVFETRHAQRDSIRVQTTETADRVDHGISRQLYRHAVGALGNAIVPQLAEWVATLLAPLLVHPETRRKHPIVPNTPDIIGH